MGKKPSYLLRLDDEGKQKNALALAERLFQEEVVILRSSVADLQNELARLDAQCKSLYAERDQLLARSEQLQMQLNAIMSSSSWQIMQSVHAVLMRHPGLARMFRRTIKLIWWTVSLQLIQRLRERRADSKKLPPVISQNPADLSSLTPRAREILTELKAAISLQQGQNC
jgi:uncharacterized protein (DUF3084 family)